MQPAAGTSFSRDLLPTGLVILGLAVTLGLGVPPWVALLGGAVIGLTLGAPKGLPLSRLTHLTLKTAVVGIGAGLNLAVVARVGLGGLGYTAAGLLLTGLVAWFLMRRFHIGSRLGTLILVGTGICGGSAIAAVAPAIHADGEEISASLATVFILNAIALLLFPVLGAWAHLAPHQYGLWCALAIHDTSSVVGAAMAGGQEALVTATTVKLARALWIVPVAFGLGLAFRGRESDEAGQGTSRLAIPWFIGGFLLVSALFTWIPAWAPAAPWVTMAAKRLLTFSLFLIGIGMSWRSWRRMGWRALQYGVLLWLAVGMGTLGAIQLGWIH